MRCSAPSTTPTTTPRSERSSSPAKGKHFGVGGDVEWEKWGLREAFYNRYPHNRLIRISRKPVIAAVQGYCLGGHNHMAYCCDFTIAADNAKFGQAGPKVSSPADGFFVPYLTKVVGAKRAREMWMLCRRYSRGAGPRDGPGERRSFRWTSWGSGRPLVRGDSCRVSPGCLEILKAAFDQEMDGYAEMGVISSQFYPDWFDDAGRQGRRRGLHPEALSAVLAAIARTRARRVSSSSMTTRQSSTSQEYDDRDR